MSRARTALLVVMAIAGLSLTAGRLAAQSAAPAPAPPPPAAPAPAAPAPPAVPSDYVIGVDDQLSIVFWRDADLSADVVVRPDGKVTLPVLNEVQAAGLTPEQLRASISTLASKFKEEPAVHVVVKQINSRKVFITGEVGKPGTYALSGRLTVIQLIALAGGLTEYAKSENIAVIRTEGEQQRFLKVNYKDVMKGKNLRQNVELKVGDVVMVR